VAAAGLQGAHAADLIPTGAEQRRHFPPLCDGLGGVAAVSQGVLVARLCGRPISASGIACGRPQLAADTMSRAGSEHGGELTGA
jgi:hypothetical protein